MKCGWGVDNTTKLNGANGVGSDEVTGLELGTVDIESAGSGVCLIDIDIGSATNSAGEEGTSEAAPAIGNNTGGIESTSILSSTVG